MNVGDIIICINNRSPYGDINLTYEKEYEIIEIQSDFFIITDDTKLPRKFLKSRFKFSLVNRRRKFISENIK